MTLLHASEGETLDKADTVMDARPETEATSIEDVDTALCSLNAEVIQLQKKLSKTKNFNAHRILAAVSKYLKQPRLGLQRVSRAVQCRKIPKLNHANEGFLTWNTEADIHQKIAVYTCITGDYDNLKEPLLKPSNIDYFVVTDSQIPVASNWSKIDLADVDGIPDLGNIKRARYVKTHPHVLFPEYDISIWVDANFLIVGDLSKFIRCLGERIPFASNWHPQRNCIYTEAEVCKLYGKDSGEVVDPQMQAYRAEGMPTSFGLLETNMIIREHNNEACIALMEAWWKEIALWSRRDQLSLPYVIWKQGYSMHDLGFTCTEIRENPSVRVVAHAKTNQ